jgi:hypothetical protein
MLVESIKSLPKAPSERNVDLRLDIFGSDRAFNISLRWSFFARLNHHFLPTLHPSGILQNISKFSQ